MTQSNMLSLWSHVRDEPIELPVCPPFWVSVKEGRWPPYNADITIMGPAWQMVGGEIITVGNQQKWGNICIYVERIPPLWNTVLNYLAGWESHLTQESGKELLYGLLDEKGCGQVSCISPFFAISFLNLTDTIHFAANERRASLTVQMTMHTTIVKVRVPLSVNNNLLKLLDDAVREVAQESSNFVIHKDCQEVCWLWRFPSSRIGMYAAQTSWPSFSTGEIWKRAIRLLDASKR